MKIIGLRDNICTKAMKTTCGSKMLENFTSPYDATVVENLNKANVEIKKVNLKEFGIEDDDYIKEAFKKSEVEAIVITDFDGVIARNSVEDLVGIKPTFGLVSRYGVVAVSPSLEQVGVVAKNVDDMSDTLDIIKGYDNRDSGSVHEESHDKYLEDAGLNIGYIDAEIGVKLKGDILKIEVKNLTYVSAIHNIISSVEASSNLARFDGIRYGFRAEGTTTWKEIYTKTRQEGFGYEVKKKMIAGTFFSDVDNMDEYYNKAQTIRTMLKRELEEKFKKVDVIAVSNKKGHACLANLTGRPAVTVKGITFIGRYFDEKNLIKLAKAYGGDK